MSISRNLPLEICLPDIESQRELVSFFNRVNMVDDLEKQVTASKTQSEMLMESVLREVFKG